MPPFLKLIRFPNLIIVGLTQYLIYSCVFNQTVGHTDITSTISPFYCSIIIAITVLIAAGGYIINDVIDLEMDLVNKPQKVFIGQNISRQKAKQAYVISIVLGFLLALFIAIQTSNLPLLFIFPLAVILLYFYSTSFKKLPFLGNIVVALFCAFVPGVLLLAEQSQPNIDLFNATVYPITMVYMLFAFLTTLLREVVKDIEDIDGDRLYACQTIPIYFGINFAKKWALFLAFILMMSFVFLIQISFLDVYVKGAIGLFLMLPLSVIIWQLYQAKDKKAFTLISQIIKVLMLSGLVFLLAM